MVVVSESALAGVVAKPSSPAVSSNPGRAKAPTLFDINFADSNHWGSQPSEEGFSPSALRGASARPSAATRER